MSITDQLGVATATWTFGPTSGTKTTLAEVRAAGGRSVAFQALVFEQNTVLLSTNENYRFLSPRNGSSPEVDTIPVGGTLTWRLDPFDYDEHRMETSGGTLVGSGMFPYAEPSEVRVRYLTHGTFEYIDRVYGGRGVVVVR